PNLITKAGRSGAKLTEVSSHSCATCHSGGKTHIGEFLLLVNEIHALVQKLIHEDSVRQKAMMEIHALVQQPYTTPNHDSETYKGGSSSEQNTHKPTSPITHGFLTEKEYQQLLQDEGVL
ncbi:hypothetical protein Tco_0866569, partial [Tanacetum coccineum]